MKITLISDGSFGDRAFENIKKKFSDASMHIIEEVDRNQLIDEYEFNPSVETAIRSSDLIISYIRHPDIIYDLCYFKKPTIVAIFYGSGLINQINEFNKEVIMPPSMCSLEPNTGIKIIDEFFQVFGKPVYDIAVDKEKNIIKSVSVSRESICGATVRSLKFLEGKEIIPETIDAFATNTNQECRESVAYRLSRTEVVLGAAINHVRPLLETLKEMAPSLFEKEGVLYNYLENKSADLQPKYF
ncbi:MAG: hypothetical protein GY870_19080 [archaeon]|nr:hypothetical protein [archaeon]